MELVGFAGWVARRPVDAPRGHSALAAPTAGAALCFRRTSVWRWEPRTKARWRAVPDDEGITTLDGLCNLCALAPHRRGRGEHPPSASVSAAAGAAALPDAFAFSPDESDADELPSVRHGRRERAHRAPATLTPDGAGALGAVRRELRRGHTRIAEKMLQDMVRVSPGNGKAWLLLCQLCANRLGQVHKARSAFAAAIGHNPRNTRLLHAYAVFEGRHGGAPETVRTLFERALQLDSTDGVTWQAYALYEARQGDDARAEELFGRGIQRDPRNASLLQALGMFHLRRDNLEAACTCLERATQANPRHVPSWQAHGVALGRLGRYADAAAKFQTALAVDPLSVPTLQAYALNETQRGDYDNARRLFQQGALYAPTHVAVYHAWARMEEELGNFEAARDVFERGVRVTGSLDAYRRHRRRYDGHVDPTEVDPVLKAWAEMESRLGHIPASTEWNPYAAPDRASDISVDEKRQSIVERLLMLKRVVDRRSVEDLRLVLSFIADRAQADQRARAALGERGRGDWEKLRLWAERRSEEDVLAFQQWIEKRYEEDRLVSRYVFGWDVLPPADAAARRATQAMATAVLKATEAAAATSAEPSVPTEWLRALGVPPPALAEYERRLHEAEQADSELPALHWVSGFAQNLSTRSALASILLALACVLSVGFASVFESGKSQIGNVEAALMEALAVPLPEGVDAHLVDIDPAGIRNEIRDAADD
ncbi:hypothetical protein CDCA_CDCA05G1502 [Cyanidium caldarium]|uniref:PsbB mRNA maturation factor Mbb1 n=1 Tax=Cyanidium caldarium TaxID=2771 RepID=A0AAV9IT90_CYACA|nr:hypothetical protein CDCA_CDCA05G1502 [Cyanidium caldarium]